MKLSRKKIKIAGIVLLVILCVVVIVQNTESRPFHLLMWTPHLPMALWIVLALAVGFVFGMLAGSRVYEEDEEKHGREVKEGGVHKAPNS